MARKYSAGQKSARTRWRNQAEAGKPLSKAGAAFIARSEGAKKGWQTRWEKQYDESGMQKFTGGGPGRRYIEEAIGWMEIEADIGIEGEEDTSPEPGTK